MATIELIGPLSGTTTPPLQRYPDDPGIAPGAGTPHGVSADDGWCPVQELTDADVPEDRSLPRPVRLTWRLPSDVPEPVRTELLLGRDPRLTTPDVRRSPRGNTYDVYHLQLGVRYFWQVTARDARGRLHASSVWNFLTHPHPPRWIHVPGTTNVRDMGGWPLPGGRRVKQGLIYRSSELDSHVELTPEGHRVLIEELGIRTDLDLRTPKEINGPVLDTSIVRWVHLPVTPYGYITKDGNGRAYLDLFRLLAQPEAYPILFHCWGGADRGGTVALLLHAILGVSTPDLIRDYELTSMSIWAERSHHSDDFQSLLGGLRPFAGQDAELQAQAEGFLETVGVTADELATIRNFLTDSA